MGEAIGVKQDENSHEGGPTPKKAAGGGSDSKGGKKSYGSWNQQDNEKTVPGREA